MLTYVFADTVMLDATTEMLTSVEFEFCTKTKRLVILNELLEAKTEKFPLEVDGDAAVVKIFTPYPPRTSLPKNCTTVGGSVVVVGKYEYAAETAEPVLANPSEQFSIPTLTKY